MIYKLDYCLFLSIFLASVVITSENSIDSGIDCLGDSISFNCSVQTNSEQPELIWTVSLPQLETRLTIRYDHESVINNRDNLGLNITALLTQFRNESVLNHRTIHLASTITLKMLEDISVNGTSLECYTEELDNDAATVLIDYSGTLLIFIKF